MHKSYGDSFEATDLEEVLAKAGAVIAHTNLYWSFQAAPGRTAAVSPAAEVSFTG